MKKIILLTLPLLGLAAYAVHAQTMMQPPMDAPPPGYAPPPPPPGYAQQQPMYAQPPVVIQQQVCQPYTDKFSLGGETRITRGTACLHPDGSWELHPAQAAVNYIVRGGGLYLVPSQPFAVVIGDHHHHDHDWHR